MPRPTPGPRPAPGPAPRPAPKRRSLLDRAIIGAIQVIVLGFVALVIFAYGVEPYSEWRCGRGAGDSCDYLIALRTVQQKPDEAKRLRAAYQHVFVEGCSRGREIDCRRAAAFAPGGITHGTGQEAVALHRLLCSQAPGDSDACFVLGVLLFRGEGQGMDVDRPGAIANLGRACAFGRMQGCTIVKELAALEPLEAKCDGGDLVACQEVEPMFALGGRVPFSWKWASRYQARACDLGSAQMCYRAGFQLKNPERTPDEARAFFVRACDMKYLAACEELALMETDVAIRSQ